MFFFVDAGLWLVLFTPSKARLVVGPKRKESEREREKGAISFNIKKKNFDTTVDFIIFSFVSFCYTGYFYFSFETFCKFTNLFDFLGVLSLLLMMFSVVKANNTVKHRKGERECLIHTQTHG